MKGTLKMKRTATTATRKPTAKAKTKATATKPTGAKLEALQSDLKSSSKWEIAERNNQQLESTDSWLLDIPVQRLREIRLLPYACYKTLTEFEKFYWITVQERRGEDGERLRHSITKLELSELKERVADYENFLKDAVKVGRIATKDDVLQDGDQTREAVKKHGKKPSTPKQIARSRMGGKTRAQIDDKYKSLFMAEWSHILNQSDNRKSKLIAERCAKGDWKHNEKIKTKIVRKDKDPITARNVADFIKRHST